MVLFLNKRQLFLRSLGWLLILTVIPLSILIWSSYSYCCQVVKKEVYYRLHVLAQKQSAILDAYLSKKIKTAEIFATTRRIVDFMEETLDALARNSPQDRQLAYEKADTLLLHLLKSFEFDDLVLVNYPFEQILYSAKKHPDFQFTKGHHVFKNTELREVVKNSILHMSTQVAVLENYGPGDQMAVFLATPVIIREVLLGVLVLQLKNEHLLSIVNDFMGLGATGEILFVSRFHQDYYFINGTRYSQKKPMPAGSSQGPNGPKDSLSSLCMETVSRLGTYRDYRNESVLAAWSYAPRIRWSILAKTDLKEALRPMRRVVYYAIAALLTVFIFMCMGAVSLGNHLYRPIHVLIQLLNRLAVRDFRILHTPGSRVQDNYILSAVYALAQELKTFIFAIQRRSNDLLQDVQGLIDSNQSQNAMVQHVSSKFQKMENRVEGVFQSAQYLVNAISNLNAVVQRTANYAKNQLNELRTLRMHIESFDMSLRHVIAQFKVLQDQVSHVVTYFSHMLPVSDQVGLLAINASIEAQRSGQNGLGFKIVADEMKTVALDANCVIGNTQTQLVDLQKTIQRYANDMEILYLDLQDKMKQVLSISEALSGTIQSTHGLPARFEILVQHVTGQERDAQVLHSSISALRDQMIALERIFQSNEVVLNACFNAMEGLNGEASSFRT